MAHPVTAEEVQPPVIKVAGKGELPKRMHPGDVGFDLYVAEAETVIVTPGIPWKFPCELDVQPPEGYWLMVVGRSSTFGLGLLVNVGIVDSSYRGPLVVDVRNIGLSSVVVEPGDRLAQLIPMGPDPASVHIERVDQIERNTERGVNGFGSTGR